MTTPTVALRQRRPSWLALALCAGLGVVVAVMPWRGSDFPAQLFRIAQVRAHGLIVWNSQWYGGHPTFEYSIVTPLLGALIGPVALGIVAGLAATALFDRVTAQLAPTRTASAWFALATIINLVIGRIAFAVGLALALAAVDSLQQRRRGRALVAALLTSLASPVAGAFLALGAAAWIVANRRLRTVATGVVVLTAAPILVVRLFFPVGGWFPFTAGSLALDVVVSALVFWLARERQLPVVMWGAAFYAAACLLFFVVPTALGGNISRLAQLVGGPLVLLLGWTHRRALAAAVVLPLLVWQWLPTVDGIAYAGKDPSTAAAYYAPLESFLASKDIGAGRVEIPFTERHWESAYVASSFALARGWERQLDLAYNPSFYDHTLDAASYRTWLIDNGVTYVALPDAPLDSSSVTERQLLLSGLTYLEPVWQDAHWRVWRVTDYHGLVDGPGSMVSVSPTSFTLDTSGGDVRVHIRYSPRWSIEGKGCVSESTGTTWLELRGLAPGRVVVSQALRGTLCPDHP